MKITFPACFTLTSDQQRGVIGTDLARARATQFLRHCESRWSEIVAMRTPRVIAEYCRFWQGGPHPIAMPENDIDMVRLAFSELDVAELLGCLFGNAILEGAAAQPSTTAGWVREETAANYREADLFSIDQAAGLKLVHRGGTAKPLEIGVGGEGYQAARFGRQLLLDEQDLADGEALGVKQFAFRQIGAAAARLRDDLVYALVLANPTMTDGEKVFSAAHSNTGTGTLATSLGTARAAIGNQVIRDADGRPAAHPNCPGKFLVVPPDLVETARRLALATALGDDGDLIVRGESRLGAAGMVDPTNDEVRTGSAANWLLAAPATAWPSIVLLAVGGNFAPQVRRFNPDPGQYGIGMDVALSLAVCAADHRGCYWSTGSGS